MPVPKVGDVEELRAGVDRVGPDGGGGGGPELEGVGGGGGGLLPLDLAVAWISDMYCRQNRLSCLVPQID